MKVELTRDTIVAGEAHTAGSVVDASDRDARLLIAIGKAQAFDAELEAEKAEAAEAVVAEAVPGGKRQRKPAKK